MQFEPPLEPVPAAAPVVMNPGAENPPWSGLDLLIVGLVLVASLFLFSSIAFVIVLLNFVPVGYFLTRSHNF